MDRHAVSERKPGKHTLTYRYRWIQAGPALGTARMRSSVNSLLCRSPSAIKKGQVTYDGAVLTNLPITAENVVETAACARARSKIEKETFNVLKSNGYDLAYNFEHGNKYLARIFATMN